MSIQRLMTYHAIACSPIAPLDEVASNTGMDRLVLTRWVKEGLSLGDLEEVKVPEGYGYQIKGSED